MKKNIVRLISGIAPGWVEKFAYRQLTSPQIHKLRKHELEILDTAEKEQYPFHEGYIQLYHWKGGDKTVFLVHGWEGQAGNFADLIDAFRNQNYSVIAFDGPSHGFSSRQNTSLFEFTELVGILLKKFEVKHIVSHSFGGVATTYALSQNPEIEIEKYALLTTPDRFSERIQQVASAVGVTDEVVNRLVARLETELDMDVQTLNVSDFVREIKVREALIIHDKADRVIPIEISRNVHRNWPNSRMEEVEGTGHFRILRTDFVIQKILDFFA